MSSLCPYLAYFWCLSPRVAGKHFSSLSRLTGLQELQIGTWPDAQSSTGRFIHKYNRPSFTLDLQAIQQLQPLTSLKLLASSFLALTSANIGLMQRVFQDFRWWWLSSLWRDTASITCFLLQLNTQDHQAFIPVNKFSFISGDSGAPMNMHGIVISWNFCILERDGCLGFRHITIWRAFSLRPHSLTRTETFETLAAST